MPCPSLHDSRDAPRLGTATGTPLGTSPGAGQGSSIVTPNPAPGLSHCLTLALALSIVIAPPQAWEQPHKVLSSGTSQAWAPLSLLCGDTKPCVPMGKLPKSFCPSSHLPLAHALSEFPRSPT